MDTSRSFEIDLETEKDSTGQSKALEFERIRSPNIEKIIVRGGKARLKVGSTDRRFQSQTDSILKNKGTIRTNIQNSKIIENKSLKKTKEVKTSSLRWLWLIMFIAAMLLFLQWRFKLFRKDQRQ